MRLGIRHSFTIQQELQADCLAGAYVGDSARANTLTLDDGDLTELRDGLAVGDDPGQPWFAEEAHGTAEQRTEAFFAGYERSLAACDLERRGRPVVRGDRSRVTGATKPPRAGRRHGHPGDTGRG